MIGIENPVVTKITVGRQRSVGVVAAHVVGYGWSLFIWPIPVLVNRLAPWPFPAAYLVVLAGLTVVCFWRAARVALVIGDSGLVVRNLLRSRRLGWQEVARLVDGRVYDDNWALTVLLAGGRAVTSTAAVSARLADPGLLTVLREHAARHEVPVDLTGISTWRPRAWDDGASSTRWYKVRLGVLLPVTAAAVAGFVVVSVWNSGHKDYGPVFLPVAWMALAALVCTSFVWFRWREALRPDPARRADYGEGDWFVVPLATAEEYAVGVIARRQRRGRGVMVGCFFAPFDSPPATGTLAELRPADAVLVRLFAKVTIRDAEPAKPGSWALLGKLDGWDRAAWPVPVFKHTDPKAKQPFKVFCDDQLAFVRAEPVSRKQARGLAPWELIYEEEVKALLAQRLVARDM